jgi:thiol-disulfide isomerase/thioredoxin
MTRILASLVLLGLVGCASKQEVADLDARIKALEEKLAKPEAAAAAKPGTPGAPPASTPEDDAASALMKEAQVAINGANFELAKTKLAEITEKYPETRAAKAATRIAAEIGIIGTDAPAMEVEKWFQGKANWDSKKATLVVFWEQWCPHCKEEMPKMQPLSEKWSSKLQVVGMTKVTKKSTDELVTQFLSENKIKFAVGKEKDGSLSKAFMVTGIPAAAIVKDGKIIWRGHPNKLTEAFLTQLLG